MADTALRERDTAAIEMHDAIRQVKKYLSSYNSSIRILKQKLSKVSEKGEEVKRCHFAYCRKEGFRKDSCSFLFRPCASSISIKGELLKGRC